MSVVCAGNQAGSGIIKDIYQNEVRCARGEIVKRGAEYIGSLLYTEGWDIVRDIYNAHLGHER